jgi:predicted Fe-Mo cluster-binding NifX family protein
MRIGITLDENKGLDSRVSMHFGQYAYFMIVEVENNQIKSHKIIENALAHGGGGCPAVGEMLKHKISYIISGGMGAGAKMKFENAGVKVFGFNGKAKDAVENLLKNNLKEIENCQDHNEHNHKCH